MLARIQRLFAVALLVSAAAWAARLTQLGHPGWAGIGALSILLGYAVFLGAEFVMLRLVQRTNSAPAPGTVELMRAWWGEVVTVPQIFLWRQPFRSNAEPDNLTVSDGVAPTGVVLVHGFFCNRGFWNQWMRELRAQRVPFIAVNLEPAFGSIDRYPLVIEEAVVRMETVTSLPVVLVGHSMGGLAIRAWLAHFNADSRVRRVITIGTPHHGTWLARFGHTANGKQMRLDSPWLTRLAASESAVRRGRFTCFFGNCDNIVFPADKGTLADAENVHVPATAHVHMAFQAAVSKEVGRWLAPATPEPGADLRNPDTLGK